MCLSLKEPDVCQSEWGLLFCTGSAKQGLMSPFTHTQAVPPHVNNPSVCACVCGREVSETPALRAPHPLQLWAGQQLTLGCGSVLSFCFLPHQPRLLFFYVSMKQTCNFHSCVSGTVPWWVRERESEREAERREREREGGWLRAFRGAQATTQLC